MKGEIIIWNKAVQHKFCKFALEYALNLQCHLSFLMCPLLCGLPAKMAEDLDNRQQ